MKGQFEEFETLFKIWKQKPEKEYIYTKEWCELTDACNDHVKINTSGKLSDRNIIVIHPYFDEIEMRGYDELDYGFWEEHKSVKKCENLIKNVDRELFNVVLFEGHLHYALKSHNLVEDGLIDRVMFTRKNSGFPYPNDLEEFRDTKENLFCGMHGNVCVNNAISEIKFYAPWWSIKQVKDCVAVYSPNIYSLLRHTNSNSVLKRTA